MLDLETHLAKLQRGLAAAGTNPAGKAIDAKAASALDIDLHALTRAAGLSGAPEVVEMTPGYLAALAGLLRSEPPGAWQAYLTARRVDAVALALPRAFRDAHFEFRGHAMGGLRAQRPRWRLAMSALDLAMGDAVGRLYTSRWLAPGTKAQADRVAERIRTTFSAAVAHADWMTPATRVVAREKLDKLVIGIGVPPRARQFSGLEIRPDDALGNLDRAHESEFREDMARVGTPVDRGLWGMPAHKANAYYNPDDNAIVLPAALLQPPFFFPGGDAAANDGTLGATIAELMSESLTDSGTMFDAEGRPRPWWAQADRREFDHRVEPLVAQYGAYEARPGKTVNGRLTLSQNVADLSGLEIAFAAFQRDQAVQASPAIDGVPAAQRFFIAFAAQYRSKAWSQRIDYALIRDPHAPARFRADGPAANLDGFHQTYATQPGDGMWRSPADRVHVW